MRSKLKGLECILLLLRVTGVDLPNAGAIKSDYFEWLDLTAAIFHARRADGHTGDGKTGDGGALS